MLLLLKYLKQFRKTILVIALLLMLQAFCELSLPAYTANIVNIGIQQGGIDRIVPEVIRQTELENLFLFMNEEEVKRIKDNYTLYLNPSTISTIPLTSTSSTIGIINPRSAYPLLMTEPLYIWNGEGEAILSEVFALPMMLLYGFNHDEVASSDLQNYLHFLFPQTNEAQSLTLIETLQLIPTDQRELIVSRIKDQLSILPDPMINQTAISYVRDEYETIGIDTLRIQNRYILTVGAKMLGLALLAMLATLTVTFIAAKIAATLGKNLRKSILKKVISFSNKEMDQFSTASLITRSTNDINQVQMLLVMFLRLFIYAPILAVGGIIKVINTNSSMTWILVIAVAAIFTIITVLYVIVMPKFKIMQQMVDRINLVMREIITGLPVIRAFSTQEHEKQRFDKANVDLMNNNLFVNRAMTFMMPTMILIMNLITILIVWVGADGINAGEMQVGDMMAFIQYTMQIIMSFLLLTMVSIMLPRATVSAKRIDEVLNTEITILDPEEAISFDDRKSGVVSFDHVYFRYPNAEEDVLSDISFTANPGETTAIIGSTGCGKSTLLNLIPRFYDVTAGSILIDGVNISKVKQVDLRKRLGFVPQKGVLFTGSIESNILFGNSKASEATMNKAARIAQAEEFIMSKEDGYQTKISQGGTNVSGGQKQRLSIARAIANNPDIYLFDDSFSALDFRTDIELRKALKEETSNSTVIIVAQRINTILNAEQIIVLEEGRIVGKGTHKDLLKNCEVYRQIAASQLSKEELSYE